MQTINISAKEMQKTFKKILLNFSFPPKIAKQCSDIFTQNSLDGIYSHGVNRFPVFVQYIKEGYIIPSEKPTIVHRFGGLEQWNGNLGPGPSNATFATNRAIKLAKKYGIGCVALSNTNHWMRGGTYGWQAAKEGCVLLGWTNTIANMPAWGASNSKLGNNPIVIAVPYGSEAVVFDMAMSQYSYGAMEMASLKNQGLAVSGGYDISGNLTNDPSAILNSMRTLPIGFWKGAGFSFTIDILASILSNGFAVHQITKQSAEIACSQVFISIDTDKLGNNNNITEMINSIVADYKTSELIDTQYPIIYPGERVIAVRTLNLKNGIPVLESIWQKILEILK